MKGIIAANNAVPLTAKRRTLVRASRTIMDITLALGGGGAKGNSHIGVIRRLEQEGYRIRAVAGSSFGGLVAVFYAAGCSPNEIEEIFTKQDQSRLYGRQPNEGPALLGLSSVERWLKEIFGEKTFDDLLVPCAVTAVDLNCGCEVILSKGSVVDALMATIAIPGVFPPRFIENWELIDGAVLNPVPVSVARALAPNLPVVAVSLTEPLGGVARTWNVPIQVPSYIPRPIVDRIARSNYARAFDIFMRSMDVVDRALAEYRLTVDAPDVLVRPAILHITTLEVVDVHQVALLGEEAVDAVLPQLQSLNTWRGKLGRMFARARK
ncbi:MAG: patatin-like phospholipase family protein [Chloroflexota bacterium]